MKHLGLVILGLLGAAACERASSKLDTVTSPGGAPGAPSGPSAAAPSGDFESRLRRIEESLARREESLAFLEKVYAQQKQQMDAREASEPAPDAVFAVDIARDIEVGQIEGAVNAPVTIVKAFDFACPYCMQLNDTIKDVVKRYEGKVRVVYKNMVVHPDTAMAAHLASCAAAKQGKYTAFKNAFWDKGFAPYMQSGGKERESLGVDNIKKIAGELGLDAGRFDTDMNGAACKKLIDDDMEELRKFNVQSTPTMFVNGQFMVGAPAPEQLAQLIDQKLKLAEASGVAGGEYYAREVLGKGEKQFRSKKQPKPN